MYFNTYFNTSIKGSPLRPKILNKVIGNAREISKNILIFQLSKNRFKMEKITKSHITLKINVE